MDKPFYVVAKNTKKNTLTVSHEQMPIGGNESKEIFLSSVNWISREPDLKKKCYAQIRYHGDLLGCMLQKKDKKASIVFDKPVLVSSGQSIVLYDKTLCLGGGIVD